MSASVKNIQLKNEEKYRLVAEKTTDVIWLLDLQGKSLFVSPSVKNFTGYSVEEYLHQTIPERFTDESAIKAQTLMQQYVRQYQEKPKDPKAYNVAVELEYRCKDGGTKWGELLVTPYCDAQGRLIAIHGATRDITERKQAEKKLRASEEKYRFLSENATDVMWMLDIATEKFTYFSPSVEVMRGYTPAEAMEIPLSETLLPESYQRAREQMAKSLTKEARSGITPGRMKLVEFEEYCKDGSVIQTETKVKFTRDKDGRATGIIGITRDITERKQAEAERDLLIKELQSTLEQVKQLKGLLPICSSCRKIRNDDGYWQDVAVYIREHLEVEFSHGICPDCAKKIYPDFFKKVS